MLILAETSFELILDKSIPENKQAKHFFLELYYVLESWGSFWGLMSHEIISSDHWSKIMATRASALGCQVRLRLIIQFLTDKDDLQKIGECVKK